MLGKTPALLYPDGAGLAQFLPDLQDIRDGKPYIGEWRAQRKDGATIWIDIRTTILLNTEGEASGFIGVAKDITESKQADEARLQLAAIVETSDDAIIGKTVEGIITGTLRLRNIHDRIGHLQRLIASDPQATKWQVILDNLNIHQSESLGHSAH
jgi:PAS domain-containing protein